MRGCVLLVVGEILNDSIYILSCWHKQVNRLEFWLGVAVVRYRLYHCRALNQIVSCMKYLQLTSDVLFQYIKLLQYRTEQLLRMLIHDEYLPPARWVDRSDCLQELYKIC